MSCWLISSLVVSCGACERKSENDTSEKVTVYCSVDESFARKVLELYRARTGGHVAAIFDSEAGKTTGLVNRIISEAATGRPRADVFWSSELFNTILLARRGLLAPYDSPSAVDIPSAYRDGQHRWTGVAVRARVLAFDPKKTSRDAVPTQWQDLTDPKFAGQVAFANPLFGTTRGHVSAMFALWGQEQGREFLTRLRDGGAYIADGNSAAVRALMAGRVRFAATDTDDVWVAQRSGASIDLVYPDMGDGGTLLVPCSVAVVKGCGHPDAAHGLVDFLVSAEVEKLLAESDSRNIPVRSALREELGMAMPSASRIEFDAVADAMDEAVRAVRDILIR